MSSSTPATIVLEWPTFDGPKYKEALAAAAIKPGELLELNSSGALILNQYAGGTVPAQKMVAVESMTSDPTSSSEAIDQDWASGDTVRYVVPLRGSVLYMELEDGQTTAIGNALGSNAAGALEVLTVTGTTTVPGSIVGYATEVVAASGSTARVKVEIA